VKYLVTLTVDAPTIDDAADLVAALLNTAKADGSVFESVVVRAPEGTPE
jgi:hypothetical protein